MLLSQHPPAGTYRLLSSLTMCPAHCQLKANSFSRVFFPFYAFFLPVHTLAYLQDLEEPAHYKRHLNSLGCIHILIQSRPQTCMLMSAVPRVLEKLIESVTPLQEMRYVSTKQPHACRTLLRLSISVLCNVCGKTFPSSISHLAIFAYQIFLHASRDSCGQI